MIDIFVKKKKFYARLDPYHKYYDRVYIITKSLLTSREQKEANLFSVGYDDVNFLQKRLDSFGLVEDRTIAEDAYQFWQWIQSIHNKNERIKNGDSNTAVMNMLEGKLKHKPFSDQYTAISYLLNNKRAGLFDEMGSGKTLISLATVVALAEQVNKTLVVCPSDVIIDFRREVKKHTYLKSIAIPSGRDRAPRFLKMNKHGDWDIMFVHPENLIVPKQHDRDKRIYSEITGILLTMPWDMVIVDEYHMYKNWEAKRTQCVLKLLYEAKNSENGMPRAIPMTGTPISETPLNAYSVLKVLSFDSIPHMSVFQNHHCIKTKTRFGKKVTGYKNLDELKARVENVSIRRTKDEMEGFPDKLVSIRDVVLTGKQLSLYKMIAGEVIKSLPFSEFVDLSNLLEQNNSMLKLRKLLNSPELLDQKGSSTKYDRIDLILEELLENPENKVVIWTAFRRSVELLYERYSKYGAVKIYGKIGSLDQISHDFQHKNIPRVAVCTAEKAGTGLDWLARARTSIYIDRPYSLTLFKQSMDRIHRRVGTSGNLTELDRIRSQPANLIFLDAVGTIDELIRNKLYEKVDLSDAMTTSNKKLIKIGREDLIRYLKAT